jgi:nucleoside-triphosphatase THEP1
VKKIVFVSGASGVGKTTLCEILTTQIGPSYNDEIAGIDMDEVYKFVDRRFRSPHGGRLYKLARHNTGCLTNNFLKNGIHTVFIFGIEIYNKLRVNDVLEYVQIDEQTLVYHFTLTPPKRKIIERLLKRQNHVPEWFHMHLLEREYYYDAKWTIPIDNSNLTPRKTMDIIMEKIQKTQGTDYFTTRS